MIIDDDDAVNSLSQSHWWVKSQHPGTSFGDLMMLNSKDLSFHYYTTLYCIFWQVTMVLTSNWTKHHHSQHVASKALYPSKSCTTTSTRSLRRPSQLIWRDAMAGEDLALNVVSSDSITTADTRRTTMTSFLLMEASVPVLSTATASPSSHLKKWLLLLLLKWNKN